jgi:hypothetical protein
MPSTLYSKTKTATSDALFQVDVEGNVMLSSINIHCYTNPAYYGNMSACNGIIQANAVVWFDKPVKVSDLWFKNYTAGSNCVITITGTVAQ